MPAAVEPLQQGTCSPQLHAQQLPAGGVSIARGVLSRRIRLELVHCFGLALLLMLLQQFTTADEQQHSAARKPTASGTASKPKQVTSSVQRSLNKPAPEGTADLRALETQVRQVVDRLIAATVSVQLGSTQGSGVIVTRDGYVLTAAHVIGAPGRDVSVVLADGRRVEAKSLGLNSNSDAGLLKISDVGEFPFVEMSNLNDLKVGDWCLALGHPGGYESGRPPVVRMGRIVNIRELVLQTDCTLVGGDSGGPLFDLDGHVIGVHSRIGAPTTLNLHVPMRAFTNNWERFVHSEHIDASSSAQRALLGIDGQDDPQGARVTAVFPKWPADVAGLKTGDIVTKIDGSAIHNFAELKKILGGKQPGETVKIGFRRGEESLERPAVLVGLP